MEDIQTEQCKKLISIIIPNWNGEKLLKECINSILEQTYKNYEIIVVDNGSTDNSVNLIKENYPEVKIIELRKNYGFSVAVNKGIKNSKGELILLLNNDIVLKKDFLEKAIESEIKYPEAGFFAVRILIKDRPEFIDTAGDAFTIAGFSYKIGTLENRDSYKKSYWCFGACGGCALYRRELFEKVGLFDEDYFIFIEDVDLSFRAQLYGYKCRFVPELIAYHKVRATFKNKRKTIYLTYRNLIYTIYKNLPINLILVYSPHLILNILLTLIKYLPTKYFFTVIKAYFDGLVSLKKFRKKREVIQLNKYLTNTEIHYLLDKNWIKIRIKILKNKLKYKKLGV